MHGIIDFYLTTSGKVSTKDERLYVTDERPYKYRLLPQDLYFRFFNSSTTFAHANIGDQPHSLSEFGIHSYNLALNC